MSRSMLLITMAIGLTSCGVSSSIQTVVFADNQATPATATVLELFTSQGCSSCPPADEILAKIQAHCDQQKLPVYCLSFHVDYWNSLGWTDPFSRPQYSQRQRNYAQAFSSRKVYTPQLIVDGETEFVGSNGKQAINALNQAATKQQSATISLQALRLAGTSNIAIQYKVIGQESGAVLNLALVQKQAENKVPRGENTGRTLAHVNVVRAFQTVPLEPPSGRLELVLPAELKASNAQLIAYVQHSQSMKISGATAANIDADSRATGDIQNQTAPHER